MLNLTSLNNAQFQQILDKLDELGIQISGSAKNVAIDPIEGISADNVQTALEQIKESGGGGGGVSEWIYYNEMYGKNSNIDLNSILDTANELLFVSKVPYSGVDRYFSTVVLPLTVSKTSTINALTIGGYANSSSDVGYIALNSQNGIVTVRGFRYNGSDIINGTIYVYYR